MAGFLVAAGVHAREQPAPAKAAAESTAVHAGERLSDWLLRQPPETASPALVWQVPQERLAQQFLKNTLLVELEASLRQASSTTDREARQQLLAWLRSLPVTGRVALGIVDARWLQANPRQDPVLAGGQRLVAPARPLETVAVVMPDGQLCRVPQKAGHGVEGYLLACGLDGKADWAWIAQADGRTSRIGVGPWNAAPGEQLSPGAWVWAPPLERTDLTAISEGMARFLATQGASPQPVEMQAAEERRTPTLPARPIPAPRALDASGNDWGETGLLQTPTARMQPAGSVRVSLTNVYPYSRLNFMFQPFDWLEAGFRYTSISNVAYAASTTGQSNKDKSIDLKLRLMEESAYRPQLALGLRDLGGTGLFSGEYFVASKRWHDLDFSLGIGWGYLGNSGNVSNPLRLISGRFATRPVQDSAGAPNFKSFFRGPAALFGGVQWQTPWDPLTLKVEYEGNDYQHEPSANNQRRRSPFNVGLNYRVAPNVVLAAGFERGDKFMLGLSLEGNASRAQTAKAADTPLPPFSAQAPERSPGWSDTAAAIEDRTEWEVERIATRGDTLHVWLTDTNDAYRVERLEKAAAVLHATAPAMIRSFVFHYSERGLPMHAQVVDRAQWVAERSQALPPHLARKPARRDYEPPAGSDPLPPAPSTADSAGPGVLHSAEKRFSYGFGPSYGQIVGGPDAFILYQVGVQAGAEYRFTPGTWLNGTVNLRLADNYDRFTYTAPSNLPRVRTYQREYVTTSRLTVPNLQLTHAGMLGRDQFYSVYGGLLEGMFAGVGAEWLYRPWRSRWAFGIDVNRVRQRGFRQDFALRDYEVNTGHASLYWDTGWYGVMTRVSVGQYLAGDRGVSLDVMRRFDNGFVLGAFATKTNVSAAQFGEGGFDKGIYLSIPLDALLPRSSRGTASTVWTPLTRDGGARLARSNSLYEMTSVRDPDAFRFRPYADKARNAGDNILDFPDGDRGQR